MPQSGGRRAIRELPLSISSPVLSALLRTCGLPCTVSSTELRAPCVRGLRSRTLNSQTGTPTSGVLDGRSDERLPKEECADEI